MRSVCDCRILVFMSTEASQVIDALGGTTAVANAIEAPTSTVHSWRKIGIPRSRLAHLRLLASVKGVDLPSDEQRAA